MARPPSRAAEVGQLQTADAVAGCPDLRVRGAQVLVDFDVIAVVDAYARVLETDTAGLRSAADRDQQQISFDRRAVVEASIDGVSSVVDRFDAAPGEKRDTLFFHDATPLLDDASVHAGQDLGEQLDDGDSRSERGKQARELAAHNAATDHQHVIWDALQAEDPIGGHDPRVFHVDAREAGRLGADTNDEVIELMAFAAGDDRVAVDKALGSNDLHPLALARRLHTSAHGEDDLFLALHHAREVHLGLGDADAEGRGVADLAQQISTGKQRLGGDASPVQAGATQLGTFDDGHLRTELCGAKRGDIAGGATAEHHDALGHAEFVRGCGNGSGGLVDG